MAQPTVARLVHYKLSEHDADRINFSRTSGNSKDGNGNLAHVGNQAREGDVCAAVVVRTFGGSAANLQVLLDGNDTYWATSRNEGDQPGQWIWPPRV